MPHDPANKLGSSIGEFIWNKQSEDKGMENYN